MHWNTFKRWSDACWKRMPRRPIQAKALLPPWPGCWNASLWIRVDPGVGECTSLCGIGNSLQLALKAARLPRTNSTTTPWIAVNGEELRGREREGEWKWEREGQWVGTASQSTCFFLILCKIAEQEGDVYTWCICWSWCINACSGCGGPQ